MGLFGAKKRGCQNGNSHVGQKENLTKVYDVCFIMFEDEDRVINFVIWLKLFEHHRALIMAARLLMLHTPVQADGPVIHVVADRLENRTERLDALSERRTRVTQDLTKCRQTMLLAGANTAAMCVCFQNLVIFTEPILR
jgi:DNA polymerase III alpha subunit